MVDTTTLITLILGSSVVSSVVTVLLQTFLSSRVNQTNLKEIERLKAELNTKTSIENQLQSKKREAFSQIASLVYRSRNMARDLAAKPGHAPSSLISEFDLCRIRIEEALYTFVLELKASGDFLAVHSYKNSLKSFHISLTTSENVVATPSDRRALEELYQTINHQYENLIKKLSDINVPVDH